MFEGMSATDLKSDAAGTQWESKRDSEQALMVYDRTSDLWSFE